jgi:hypothetical protein
MDDQELAQLLRDSLEGEMPPDLTGEEIRELLSSPIRPSRADTEKGRADFAKRLIASQRPELVRRFGVNTSFGGRIRSVRENLPLTVRMVAAALNWSPHYVESIESDSIPLWQREAKDVAILMDLFEIHIQAVESILPSDKPKATRANRDRPADIGITGRRTTWSRDITAFEPGGSRQEFNEPTGWLAELRKHLTERGADRLLN